MLERIQQPETIISIVAFIFSLGGVWATLNSRIKALEEFKKSVDLMKIEITLTEMQKDIQYIKETLSAKNK